MLVVGFRLFRLFHLPVRWVSILVINSVAGGIALSLLNDIFRIFGFTLGINILTSAVTDLLGVAGLAARVILHFLL